MPRDYAFAPGRDLWVFGYGSLMWSPGFSVAEKRVVRVFGFHRSLCISSHRYRGTPERPGLVLGLEPGGCCWGAALRADAAQAPEVLAYLWEREMITQAYRPLELAAYGGGGSAAIRVLAFVAKPDHPQYAGGLDERAAAARVAACRGECGPNIDYVAQTVAHLTEIGVADRRLARVLRLAAAIRPADVQPAQARPAQVRTA